MEKNRIYHGKSEILLENIKANSIALSFWSPPYFVGKEYEKYLTYSSWQIMLKTVIEHHARILKPAGFMVINIADIKCFKDEKMPKFQALNVSKQRCPITQEMIISAKKKYQNYTRYQLASLLGCSEQTIDRRLNGNNIRGGKYETQTRVKLVGGNIERFSYKSGLYLYDHKIWQKDPAWANSKWTSNSLKSVDEYEDIYIYWKPGELKINRDKLKKEEWNEWGQRGVWNIKSVRANKDHEAKFPIELAERIVKLYSEENEIVLDPFVGSGTTALAALKLGRNFIGIDKEEKYVALARKNISFGQNNN